MPTLVTTSANFSAELRTYYENRLLYVAMPELVHLDGADSNSYTIPDHNGKTIQWRRWPLLAPKTTPLTEGVTPPPSNPTVEEVLDTVQQYGDYVLFSDVVNVTSIDNVMRQITKLQGQQSGNTLDIVARDAYNLGTVVFYANGKPNRGSLTSSDTIDGNDMIYVLTLLRNQNARTFPDGLYHWIAAPAVYGDIMKMTEFQQIGAYQKAETIYRAQVVDFYGFRFYMTTNAKVFYGAGAGGIDVFSNLAFGEDALGRTNIEGLGMQNFYKPLGSAGTFDPLNQRQSNGWKTSFVATILNQNFLVRYECASSLPAAPPIS